MSGRMNQTVPIQATARRRLLVIYNPTAGAAQAGRKRARFQAYLEALEDSGAAVEYRPTTRRGDAEAFAAEGSAEKFDAVVAAGGDGTIAEVANGLPQENAAPLGLLPLGTANVLAQEIGLSLKPGAVLHCLREGPVRPIHAGYIASLADGGAPARLFTMMAGIGFDAHVVASLSPNLKRRLGKGAYVVESLKRLMRWPGMRYRIVIEGEGFDCASAVVAKGHFYGGRFVVAPNAELGRPEFEICLFKHPGRWGAARALFTLPLGLLHRLPEIELKRGRYIELHGPAGDPVQADGDIAAHLPARVYIGPAPLKLIMPR